MRVFVLLPAPGGDENTTEAPPRAMVLPGGDWARRLASILGLSPEDDLVLAPASMPAGVQVDAHAPVAAVNAAVRRAEHILSPQHDPDMTAIVGASGSAAIDIRLGELQRSLGIPPLLDRHRQDPEATTVAAVRTVAWAAEVLRVPCPAIYARADLPGGLVSAPAEAPAVVLGKAMLTDHAIPELAYLATRELASPRATASLAIFFPTVSEVPDLILTAISLYLPHVAPNPPLPGLREALAARLGTKQRRSARAGRREPHAARRKPRRGRVPARGRADGLPPGAPGLW